MATIDLGKIKQVWRGTYNNGTAYTVDDLVAYTDTVGGLQNTSTYICVTNSTGNAPASAGTVHGSWNLVAQGVPDRVPSQSGNSGKVLKSFPTIAVVSVNRVPVSCIPSPESPANRITTLSKFFVLMLNFYV